MTTRTITGPLRHPESDTLWASATLTFRLRAPFVSSGATYPTETITVTSDGSGQFSVALAVPPSGTVLYIVTLPDGRELGLNLSTGTATTLHALLATAQAVVPQNALQTAIDAEAAVRAAADTTLQANIDTEATARASADSAHASLTTTAHGGIVASSDSRLSDSRTPTAHASTHASAGSDPLTLAESQITGLVSDLALKAPLASPTFTGVPAAPTAAAGTNTTQLATTAFVQAAAGATSVLAYGAVGDGVTDDTLAIRAAITAAGVNGTLLFPSGKTFLISGNLNPLTGQTWIGYGATLKRRAEISSATATNIGTGAGSTAITVANGALFSVGQDVTVFNGASYDPHNHRITAIAGNVVTVGTAFTVAFASGGTLITSVTPIYASSINDLNITGLEIDGNQSNNTTLQKWDLNAEMYYNGDRNIIHDCYVHDCQSEGIEVGGVGVVVDNCTVLNCQGNGIHLFGAAAPKVTRNYVKNCNLAGTGPGHADGCIIASNTVSDTLISQNYIENGICGIGSFDSDDNSSLICTDNTIRSCTGTAFEGTLPAVTKAGKIIFSGNQIYNSIKVTLSCTNTSLLATQGVYKTLIANNYLEDTTVQIAFSGNDIGIRGNTIYNSGTSALLIYVDRSANVGVSNNTLIGGGYGVYVDGTTTRDVDIAHNNCRNQNNNGVKFNVAPTANCKVDGNTIVQESGQTPSSSYAGIAPANGVFVTNNQIDIETNTTGQFGILCPNGGASTQGAIVTNNLVRSLANVPSIRTPGGSQKNVIVNNFVVQAVSDGGSPNNTVSGNTTIL
jgi:parallel beta-helix repeat protein